MWLQWLKLPYHDYLNCNSPHHPRTYSFYHWCSTCCDFFYYPSSLVSISIVSPWLWWRASACCLCFGFQWRLRCFVDYFFAERWSSYPLCQAHQGHQLSWSAIIAARLASLTVPRSTFDCYFIGAGGPRVYLKSWWVTSRYHPVVESDYLLLPRQRVMRNWLFRRRLQLQLPSFS